MSKKLKVTLNHANIASWLRSDEVSNAAGLQRRARAIAAAAGPGFEVEDSTGQTRARYTVYAATVDAMRAEATDRALTRAIDAGRS